MLYYTIDCLDESLMYAGVNKFICNHVFNRSIAHYLVKKFTNGAWECYHIGAKAQAPDSMLYLVTNPPIYNL